MEAEPQSTSYASIIVRGNQPLIGLVMSAQDMDSVVYFTTEDEADLALDDDAIQDALSLAGAWSDLSWDELEAGLDRLRHESEPTPPFEQ